MGAGARDQVPIIQQLEHGEVQIHNELGSSVKMSSPNFCRVVSVVEEELLYRCFELDVKV